MPIAKKKPLSFNLDLNVAGGDNERPEIGFITSLVHELQQLVTFTSAGQPVEIDGIVIENLRTGKSESFELPEPQVHSHRESKPIGGQPMKGKRRDS